MARVARVKLTELSDASNRFSVRASSGFQSPGFAVGELFIWGFTGALLARAMLGPAPNVPLAPYAPERFE